MKKFLFLNVCHEKKLSSVRIEPATVGSEPILAEKRHLRKSRPEADITKSCKIKFQLGPGGFFNIRKCFGTENSIFKHFCSVLPARPVAVNICIAPVCMSLKSRQKST